MKEFQLKEDFQSLLNDIPRIFLYHSKNDKDIPFQSLKFYEKAFTSAVVRTLPGQEHTFSKGLPALVSDIQTLVTK